MGVCLLCQSTFEGYDRICRDCKPFYKNRATNNTLPAELRPYSAQVTEDDYALLHQYDSQESTGEMTHEDCERCRRELTQSILERITGTAKSELSAEEKHRQAVAAYLKTFD